MTLLRGQDWPTETDALVEALRQGSDEAGAFLVSQLAPLLVGYARLIGPDLSDVDRELLCERAVERAVARIDRYASEKGSFVGWVRGIFRNELKEWRRRMPRATELDEDASGLIASIDNRQTVSDRQDSRDPVEVLAELLNGLAPTDALIIRLHDIEGLPFKVIAEQLDVQEAACRQRHHRALNRLRNHAGIVDQALGGE